MSWRVGSVASSAELLRLRSRSSPDFRDSVRPGGPYAAPMAKTKKYGFGSFLLDAVLTLITGGIWLIWIFVREMRRR